MDQPISIPNNSILIPVNLSSSYKTFTLPVVSTNAGRTIIFKDMFGNATNSTIRLSTIGLDRIERSNVSSMALSNAYGAWWFNNDGISKWFLTSAYTNSLIFSAPFSNFLWSQFRNITSNAPSCNAGETGWGAAIGRAGAYNPINYSDNDSRIGQNDNFGVVCKGYFYSTSNTYVQFRILVDDGGYVWYNNIPVISTAWKVQGATTYTSPFLSTNTGYNPFQFNYFEWSGGATCQLSYSVAGGAFTSDGSGRFFYDATSMTYP